MLQPDSSYWQQLFAVRTGCLDSSTLCLRHFFCKGIGVFCLEHDATVQWQGEGAWGIRTAKAFETQGSPSFYQFECNQGDSVDVELNSVTRNGLNR